MKLRILFLLFFIVILAVAGLFFYYKDTIFSEEFLKLEIAGQDQAKSGDEITYTIHYRNNSKFILKNAKIVFELPENSLTEDNKLRITQDIKDIAQGEDGSLKFAARILGKEGDVKIARVWFSYVPENLSAKYESDVDFKTTITEAPMDLTFSAPEKVESGRQMTLTVRYTSDIDYPLEKVSIKLQSPPGFVMTSSSPSSLDGSEWKLPTLLKGKNGTVTIVGILKSQDSNVANFSLKIGQWQDGSFVTIKEAKQDIIVTQPSIGINQLINNTSDYIAKPGELLNYQIAVKNNGSAPMSGVLVLVKLSGRSLDLSSINSAFGQISPADNSILFDAQKTPTLALINPGQEVMLPFSVKLKDDALVADAESIKSKVTVGDLSQEFITTVKK